MADRADAHIHLFERALPETFSARPGVRIDQAACYDSLAAEHDVAAALVVCYEASAGNERNNDYVARRKGEFAWIRPVAYVDPVAPPSVEQLERWRVQGFVGLAIFIDAGNAEALLRIADPVWQWMTTHRWLLSVNSKGESWSVFKRVLDRFEDLRLLISHLGLPPEVAAPIDGDQARQGLAHQLTLAAYPEVRVKLSGFYALTAPSYDYPHELAWPYVEAAKEAFGAQRLLWASDYAPCLDHQTFPQTLGLFWKMPFLSEPDRDRIAGGNLLDLLDAVD